MRLFSCACLRDKISRQEENKIRETPSNVSSSPLFIPPKTLQPRETSVLLFAPRLLLFLLKSLQRSFTTRQKKGVKLFNKAEKSSIKRRRGEREARLPFEACCRRQKQYIRYYYYATGVWLQHIKKRKKKGPSFRVIAEEEVVV